MEPRQYLQLAASVRYRDHRGVVRQFTPREVAWLAWLAWLYDTFGPDGGPPASAIDSLESASDDTPIDG